MYCIGLMSGTSVDGIDAALIDIEHQHSPHNDEWTFNLSFVSGMTYPYPSELRSQILAVCAGEPLSMAQWAELDEAIARQFALAAQTLQPEGIPVQVIGSHGQTVFHRPPHPGHLGYTVQLGRGQLIANLTQIPTLTHFRDADIAAGGQGAPLVSKIDAYFLSHSTYPRCVQNIGGIGNVTYLPPRHSPNWLQNIKGWDTGPGNVLIDLAVQQMTQGQQTYDQNGFIAFQGSPCQELVNKWLQHPFFGQTPPKSTGRELFSPDYLAKCWQDAADYKLSEADWVATLSELTVASIVKSYQQFLPSQPVEILLCGGGSRNLYLKKRLQERLSSQSTVMTTDEVGFNSDFKEAIAFAVLAYWRFYCHFPGNLPTVTGAKQPCLLGEVHLP